MFTSKDNYNGAKFDYQNGACEAHGDYRFLNGALETANIYGTYTQDEQVYTFSAGVDNNGIISVRGVSDAQVLVLVATEVAAIVNEIKTVNE